MGRRVTLTSIEWGNVKEGDHFEDIGVHGRIIFKKNSVALVRERTIPTERPPPVGEVSANFCG